MSPGKWDGKSRPTNKKYRKNYDAIFKKNKKDNNQTLKKKRHRSKGIMPMNGGVWIVNTVLWMKRMTSVQDVEPRTANTKVKKR